MRRLGLAAVRASAAVLGVVGIGLAPPAAPDAPPPVTVRVPPAGDPAWRPVEFPSIPRHTQWDAIEVDGEPVWRAVSRCSASGMAVPLEGIDLSSTPILRWRWKVDEPLPPQDEGTVAGDDFAARVSLLFRFDPADTSWRARMERRIGRWLWGVEPPSAALFFVWSSRQPAGSEWDHPNEPGNPVIALRSAEDGGWHEERVDVEALRQRLLPGVHTPVAGLALMTDSDQSCAEAGAEYGGFRFELRAEPPAPTARPGEPDAGGDAKRGPAEPAPAP